MNTSQLYWNMFHTSSSEWESSYCFQLIIGRKGFAHDRLPFLFYSVLESCLFESVGEESVDFMSNPICAFHGQHYLFWTVCWTSEVETHDDDITTSISSKWTFLLLRQADDTLMQTVDWRQSFILSPAQTPPPVSQSVISVTQILALPVECTAVWHMDNTTF